MKRRLSHLFIPTLWVLVIITFIMTVYPELLQMVIALPEQQKETILRFFSGANAILLAILSIVGVASTQTSLFRPASKPKLLNEIPSSISSKHKDHAEPCKYAAILCNFPSHNDGDDLLMFLRRASILGNLRPILVHSERDFLSQIKRGNVSLGIIDRKYYEDCVATAQEVNKPLLLLKPGNKFGVNSTGLTTTISIVEGTYTDQQASEVAKAFASRIGIDTPRGVGFHGNWSGTYGLIAFQQSPDMTVTGVYWYGNGVIEGRCEVDIENEMLVLQYNWNQSGNKNAAIGSANKGQGVFLIPAGFEFFYGYWHQSANAVASQCWCASRLSRDVSEALRDGSDPISSLGLKNHSFDNLVAW